MENDHVVSALVRKYAEVKGELKVSQKRSRKLRDDLTHLDAVLRLFRTNYETAKSGPSARSGGASAARAGALRLRF
jgi:hypothetical protein